MDIKERSALRVSGADLRPMAKEIVTKEIDKGTNTKVFNILRGAGRKVKVLKDRDAANKQSLRVQIEGEKMNFSSIREKTKWKMGDGRPRNGARIENDRFWNLPYDSLKYIAKDAGEAMKANPTARKATTGPGNWADQVADAATVMQWRKKNGIKESVELDEQQMDQKMFDSLKKGDKLSVSFGSGIRKDNKVTLQVKSKSKSAKYNLEKINCFNVQNPGGMKYTIYNRQGKFSLAQGDMGTHGADFVKESVELDEAIDFFKVSKELSDYAKKHGGPDKREFEKAAAYVREIGKNSAVSVQDKAGKGLNMLFKNADTDVRDRMQMILKKGGFKVQGGHVMREGKWFVRQSAKPNKTKTYQGKQYDDGKKAIAQARKDLKLTPDEHMSAKMMKEAIEEGLNPKQIALLKKNYASIDRVDPSGPAYKKAKGMIAGLDKDMQMDLAKAKVKFLSQIAADELRKQHGVKLKAKDYMESVEEGKFMLTVPKGGPAGKDLNMKVSGKDKMDAVKQWRKKYPKFKNDAVDVSEEILTKAARRDKDAKKAVKTYKDIRKGKYPGVKMAKEADDDKRDNDPCWDSHKMVGMKKKNGKEVPNCVPK